MDECKRTGGKGPIHPNATRWCSHNNMVQSVHANRQTIENTLSRMRRERYNNDDFKALAWVCNQPL